VTRVFTIPQSRVVPDNATICAQWSLVSKQDFIWGI
jgi:hypothetical protein